MNDYLLWGALAGVAGLLVAWRALRRKPKGFHRAPRAEAVASVQSSTGGPPSIDTVSAAYRVQSPITDSRQAAEAAAREAADREAAEWEAQLHAQHEAQEAARRAPQPAAAASPPTLNNAVTAPEAAPLRLQTEEEFQAVMDREATAATEASTAPTLTDVVTGPVNSAPLSETSAEDSGAARREAAAQLARERAEREAAEAEAWLDEQRRVTEARRARAALDTAAASPEMAGDAVDAPAPEPSVTADIGAFEFQIEVPRLQTEEERYAEVERETAEIAARVQAQRVAIDQLGVASSLGIELEFPALPDAGDAGRADALPTLDAMAVSEPPLLEAARSRHTPDQFVVMVADDSKVVRVKTSRLLLKQGYQVLLAEDGLDAVKQIALRVPDVLITDVEMPGLDGFGLTRQMRADARTAQIPIVMITADDEKHRVAATAAGVSVLLSKPYPEDRLLSYLEETLGCAVAAAG
jgi:CheY-like chemotaxis protein